MKTLYTNEIIYDLKKSLKLMLLCFIFVSISEPVFSHGTVIWPKSRIKQCHENPTGNNCQPCGGAIYEWRSILQPHTDYGKHRVYVPDGQLASGGNPGKYGCLDALISWPTQSDWRTTKVNYGDIYVKWQNTAPHRTEYYKVYITPLDWDPSKPLNWDDLIEIGHKGKGPAEDFTVIKATIPDSYIGKRAALYSVWQREYTHSHEAFYSVSDINVVRSGGASSDGDTGGGDDGGGDDNGGGDDCGTAKKWNQDAVYVKDDVVSHQGDLYRAKWWTKNHNPTNNSGPWQVWEKTGSCNATPSQAFTIVDNYPNPFREVTSINYKVNKLTKGLSMTIRTLDNLVVHSVFSKKRKSLGKHKQPLNINGLAPGVYLCVLEDENGTVSRKKILIK